MKRQIAVVMSSVVALGGMMSTASMADSSYEKGGELTFGTEYPERNMVVDPEEFLKNPKNTTGPNVITDDNLRFRINLYYGRSEKTAHKDNVTKEMIENLIYLSPEQCGPHTPGEVKIKVKSVEGLQYAKNLEWLSIIYQDVETLEPLKNCKKLRYLGIRGLDKVKDLSPISGLTNLESLDIQITKPDSIDPIKNLKKLRHFNAVGSSIDDISALKNLTNLEYLGLDENSFTDISALSNLTALKTLLIGRQVATQLEEITGKGKRIGNIEALKNLVHLEELDISGQKIEDISPLAKLTMLRKLNVGYNNITDFSVIENFDLLKDLITRDNAAKYVPEKISPIEQNKTYEVVSVKNPSEKYAYIGDDLTKDLPEKVKVKVRVVGSTGGSDQPDVPVSATDEGISVVNPNEMWGTSNNIKYAVVDESGKLIKDRITFNVTPKSPSVYYPNVTSENGYIVIKDIEGFGEKGTINLATAGYSMRDSYTFEEKSSKNLKVGKISKGDKTLYIKDEWVTDLGDKGFMVVPPKADAEKFHDILKIVLVKDGGTRTARLSNSFAMGAPDNKAETLTIEVPVKWDKDEKVSTKNRVVYNGTLIVPENVRLVEPKPLAAVFNLSEKTKVQDGDEPSTGGDTKPGTGGDTKPGTGGSSTGGSSSGGSTTKPSDKKPEEKKLPYTISRVAGNDRIATSVDLSKKYYKTADTVVVASGYNYPDALVASSMSSTFKAPILLTKGNKLPDSVKEEIKRLGAKNVYIIGGESAVDPAVMEELAKLGVKVERVSGADRYETSLAVFKLLGKEKAAKSDIIVASGQNFADALSAATLTASGDKISAVVLTRANAIPKDLLDEINASKDYSNIYVVGGEGSVSKAALESLAKAKRVSGADRYETSVAVAKLKYPNAKVALVASGQSFPDALAAGGVTKVAQAPIVLAKKTNSAKSTIDYLKTLKDLVIVGGVNSINDGQFK